MENSQKTEWFVILNPHAGSGRGMKDKTEILKKLNQHQLNCRMAVSEFPRHTIQLTAQAIAEGYRKLIVAGGDGTLNEAVNGIFSQTICPPEEITLGMIPVGTGNDWIKTFGIPNQYEAAIKIIKEGKTMRQDIGCITFSKNDLVQTRYFANMAGFGFDAMAAAMTNRLKNKGKKGLLLYLQALLLSLFRYKTGNVKITIDDREMEELIFSVSIGIGRYNGGGMKQAPAAIPDNGLFQVTVIRKIGLFGILRNLSGLYSGEYIKDRRVATYLGRRVWISADQNIAGEADGEILGDNQFKINLLSKRLNVIYYPEKYLN
jgi:YegS/Rv2252/BmrU family lipid kinase